MKYIVCAMRDRASDLFGQPVFVNAVGAAIRGFGDEINNKEAQISKHPEDYDLYQLGTYDDETGAFDCGTPRQIAIGKDMVRN